jgi:hypothetical protein
VDINFLGENIGALNIKWSLFFRQEGLRALAFPVRAKMP